MDQRYRKDLSAEEQLEWHLAEAHHHILRARDLIYGTWGGAGPIKRGWRIRNGLDQVNTLMFKIQRKNRKEQ